MTVVLAASKTRTRVVDNVHSTGDARANGCQQGLYFVFNVPVYFSSRRSRECISVHCPRGKDLLRRFLSPLLACYIG